MDNLISHQRVNSTGRVVVSDEYNRPLTVAELMLEYPQESRGRISVISYEWEKAVSIASGQEARDRQGAHHASHETRKASLIVIGRSPTATFNVSQFLVPARHIRVMDGTGVPNKLLLLDLKKLFAVEISRQDSWITMRPALLVSWEA
ncbi:hypothetical protein LguiB_028899 [Lonicera macranthoides]